MSTSTALESLLPVRWTAIAAVAAQSSLVRWLYVCASIFTYTAQAHMVSLHLQRFVFARLRQHRRNSTRNPLYTGIPVHPIVIRSGMVGLACVCVCVFISSTATYAARHCLVGNHANCSRLAISYQNNAHFLSNAECCHNINRDGNAKHSKLRIRLT